MKTDKNSQTQHPVRDSAQSEQAVPDNKPALHVLPEFKELTFAQWFKRYRPRVNRKLPPPTKELKRFLKFNRIEIPKNAPPSCSLFNGRLFWMKGPEFRFVQKQPLNKIWTLIDEGDHCFIHAGFHPGRELGYFVTRVAAPANRIFHIQAD